MSCQARASRSSKGLGSRGLKVLICRGLERALDQMEAASEGDALPAASADGGPSATPRDVRRVRPLAPDGPEPSTRIEQSMPCSPVGFNASSKACGHV